MRTLHLIKPWALRTVRQRLDGQHDFTAVDTRKNIPCCGPAGDEGIRSATSLMLDIRFSANKNLRNSFTAKAPLSAHIFASLCNNR